MYDTLRKAENHGTTYLEKQVDYHKRKIRISTKMTRIKFFKTQYLFARMFLRRKSKRMLKL